jgi:hypothetical protein
MLTKARTAIMATAFVVSTQAIAAGEPDLSNCCLFPGGAKGMAPHVQNMRWETHGITPVTTGERHMIGHTWPTAE